MELGVEQVVTVQVVLLDEHAVLPVYATPGSSGFDLCTTEDVLINPKETASISTGLAMAVPKGYEVQLRPRSGISRDTDLWVRNSPSTIDSDYRGEIKLLIYNSSDYEAKVWAGTKLVQGVLCPVVQAQFEVVASLDTTERGSNGFGSTGV